MTPIKTPTIPQHAGQVDHTLGGPTEIDPRDFLLVGGGLESPKGGWAAAAGPQSPKGGWY